MVEMGRIYQLSGVVLASKSCFLFNSDAISRVISVVGYRRGIAISPVRPSAISDSIKSCVIPLVADRDTATSSELERVPDLVQRGRCAMESVMTERSSSPWGQSRRQILDLPAQLLQPFVDDTIGDADHLIVRSLQAVGKVWVRVSGRQGWASVPLRLRS